MEHPTTKEQLLALIHAEHTKLDKKMDGLSAEEMVFPGAMGDWSVKDILAHLMDWEQRLVSWYEAGLRGDVLHLPAPGFHWGQLPALNQQGYEHHKHRSLQNVADCIAHQVLALIGDMTEEMFEVGRYAWTGKNRTANTANTSSTTPGQPRIARRASGRRWPIRSANWSPMSKHFPSWAVGCAAILPALAGACARRASASYVARCGGGITLVPSWTPTPFVEQTATPTDTPIPATLTPTPGPSPTYNPLPVFNPQTGITMEQLATPDSNVLSGLIVFSSAAQQPFNFPQTVISIGPEPPDPEESGPWLWAFSPDGQRGGRLTLSDLSFAAYVPPDPAEPALFVGYGMTYSHSAIQTVSLPGECYGMLPEDEAQMGELLPCSDFQFSPDGSLLGFYFGPEVCGRGIIILDTRSGEILYRSDAGVGHSFEFLDNGKALVGTGHCEGGWLNLFDPATRTLTELGAAGTTTWNADHTALATRASTYMGLESVVWGYNVALDLVFLPEPSVWALDDHPLWAPEGQHLLYQHRSLAYDGTQYTFDGPRAIMIVNAQTGQQDILAGDAEHDYHLCPGSNGDCDVWYGDWVQVQRVPFQPQTFSFEDALSFSPSINCLVHGIECAAQQAAMEDYELLMLNRRTGELLPWDPQALPTPPPIVVPTTLPASSSGPDLDRPPVYAHPDGLYAFYVGLDGHSLWLVAAGVEPELWVTEGSGFLYLP
jgi:hypothetical protein